MKSLAPYQQKGVLSSLVTSLDGQNYKFDINCLKQLFNQIYSINN